MESQSNHPAIGGANLKIEDLSTRICNIDRMMQSAEQCWVTNKEGIKWIKDQLCETQTNVEVKSRDCKSYTDKQNTHNMAVSTTLNSKLEQMVNVLNSTAQKINTLESKYSSQASSSGLNDHAGGRRAASRTPDKRPPPPSPPDNDPPPPPPPDLQRGKKSAAGGNPGNAGEPRCTYMGDGRIHLVAEFHCKGCKGAMCEYCFSFKEDLCEECSRDGPRCCVCRESSFLTKGINCQFCKTYYCTRHSAGQDDYRRFGFVKGPCCLACLGDESRRRRGPDATRIRNRSPGGAPETNPTRSYSPPLRPPVDRSRDVPGEDQPNPR